MAKLFAYIVLVLLLGCARSEDGKNPSSFPMASRKLMQRDKTFQLITIRLQEADLDLGSDPDPDSDCSAPICNFEEGEPPCASGCTCDSNLACSPGEHPPQL